MSFPLGVRVTFSSLERELVRPHKLVWRKQIAKNKLGPPIQHEDFPNPPKLPYWNDDRAGSTSFNKGEHIKYWGQISLKRGVYYLCEQ